LQVNFFSLRKEKIFKVKASNNKRKNQKEDFKQKEMAKKKTKNKKKR
jgi:hypothetical protein